MPFRKKNKRSLSRKREGANVIKSIALELFTQKGYKATSVRDICTVMEITAPSLYYYYDSKESLYSALLQEAVDGLSETLEEALSSCQNKSMKGKLKCFYSALLGLHEKNSAQMLLLLKERYFPERKKPQDAAFPITSWLSPLEEEIITFLEDSGKPQRFTAPTDQVLVSFDRLITGLILQKTQENEEVDADQAWEMFVKGI